MTAPGQDSNQGAQEPGNNPYAPGGYGPPPGGPWPGFPAPPGQHPFPGGQFIPPPPPHPPVPAHAPGPTWGRKRLLLFGTGAGVIVLTLLAGLLFLGGEDSEGPAADGKESAKADPRTLQPYYLAVAGLAFAPGLRYKDDLPGGIMKRQVTVTAAGSRFGNSGFGREELDQEILSVGGKTFTRWRVDPTAKEGAKKPSVWNAGAGPASGLTDELTKHRPSPQELADQFLQALAELEDKPPAGGYSSRSRTVDGTEAQALDTPAGQLIITRKEPYRVLRLEPPSGFVPGPARSRSADPASYRTARTAADDGSQSEGPFDGADTLALDLEPVTEADAPAMYGTLEKQTKELGKAGDSGISLSLNGAGTVSCSSGGCTATANFSGQITSDAKSRLVGGQVTAVMTSTFSIDGQPGGSCTSAARTFPVSGSSVSGSITCSNPGAGATFASIESRKKAEAQARSRANGGRPVQYSIPLRANSLINARAMATVEVKKLVERVQQERDVAKCATPHSFLPGTPVLLADGTRRAIEEVRVGDRVLATDPLRGITQPRAVTDTIRTEDDKDFTRLTVRTAGRTATVTATDTHPFWVADEGRWAEAREIGAGDELHLPDGGSVAVTAVNRYERRQRTHDLTVDGIHTYYVGAGDQSVLVHNNDCRKAKPRTDTELKALAKQNAKSATEYQNTLVREQMAKAKAKARAEAQKAGKSDADISRAEAEAATRAKQFTEKDYTTAVVRARFKNPTSGQWEERNVVARSGPGKLSPAQLAAVRTNGDEAVQVNFKGATHAEQKILLYIEKLGGEPIAGGASRNVCLDVCKPLINAGGGKVEGDVVPGRGTGVRTFWFPDTGELPGKNP